MSSLSPDSVELALMRSSLPSIRNVKPSQAEIDLQTTETLIKLAKGALNEANLIIVAFLGHIFEVFLIKKKNIIKFY